MTSISKEHLAFMERAKKGFEENSQWETFQDANDSEFIALRMGVDRDCINVYELGSEIANFTQQLEPTSEKEILIKRFSTKMNEQLVANDHKKGWDLESHFYLESKIEDQLRELHAECRADNKIKNRKEIIKRAANIANYAMMIANNEGYL